MSQVIKDRIVAALNSLEDLGNEDIPALPQLEEWPVDTEGIDGIVGTLNNLEEEYVTSLIEIRQARADWTKLIEKLPNADRPAEGDAVQEFNAANDLANRLRDYSNRTREVRRAKALAEARRERDRRKIAEAANQAAQQVHDQQQLIQNQNLAALQALQAQIAAGVGHAGANPRGTSDPPIPKYSYKDGKSGKTKWHDFWTVFALGVHNDVHMAVERKMIFLKGKLLEEAYELIDGLPFTAEGYNSAVELLQATYGNKDARVRDLYQELNELKRSQKFEEDKKNQVIIERVCRSLNSLGHDTNASELYQNFQNKLSKPTIRAILDIKLTQQQANQAAEWNTQTFRAALKLVIAKEKEVNAVYGTEQKNSKAETKKPNGKKEKGGRETPEVTLNSAAVVAKTKGQKGPREQRETMMSTSAKSSKSSKTPSCRLCDLSNHWSSECKKYSTATQRLERAKLAKLCLRCLSNKHFIKECKAKQRQCYYCKANDHNRVFCKEKFPGEASVNFTGSVLAAVEKPKHRSLLVCKRVSVYNPSNPNKKVSAMVFFDGGSEKTYITKRLEEKLELPIVEKVEFKISGLAGTELGHFQGNKVRIGLQAGNFSQLVEACPINRITVPLPYVNLDSVDIEAMDSNKLGDMWDLEEPDIMIGIDYYNHFAITPHRELSNGFWIVKSKVGFMLNGKGDVKALTTISAIFPETSMQLSNVAYNEIEVEDELQEVVKKHFNAETIGLGEKEAEDKEQEWLEAFIKSVNFTGERYEVALPWNGLQEELPNNYGLALGRLRNNIKRLRERPELLKIYHDIIREQFEKGMIEEAPWKSNGLQHYLPHAYVLREDHETTKLRIVIHANAKSQKSGISLNDCLAKGPNLMNELAGVIIRGRLWPTLIISDIEKAFLQIQLLERDRDAVRFLWYQDPYNENSPLVVYRFTRVAFGVVCSPSQLATVLKVHLDKYDSPLSTKLKMGLYVDNIAVGYENESTLQEVYDEQKTIFSAAGMNVRAFASNNVQQMQKLPKADQVEKIEQKLLGIPWNLESDELQIKLATFDENKGVTRRRILSFIAATFDPLGLISPALLTAKLFLQKIVIEEKAEWDQELPITLKIVWKEIVEGISGKRVKLRRQVCEKPLSSATTLELHAFADASAQALGIAIYLRASFEQNHFTALVFGKSLVKPANLNPKEGTIPKLELHALVIAVGLVCFVRKEIEKEFKIDRVLAWSDSMDVVDWLRTTKKKDRFVENRVRKIREFEVRHIKGEENPADVATRGMEIPKNDVGQLVDISKLWANGPEWLTKNESQWPKPKRIFDPQADVSQQEEIPLFTMSTKTTTVDYDEETIIKVSQFSGLERLKRRVGFIRRAVELFRGKKKKKPPAKDLIAEEYEEAEIWLIRNAQLAFPPKVETVDALGLFKDEQDVFRCKGRIENSNLTSYEVHPYYLPREAKIVALIIWNAHITNHHVGQETLVSILRQKYWIPQVRKTINSVIKVGTEFRCWICAKFRAKPYIVPSPPPLPKCRVSAVKPFAHVGIDYFGPMHVKAGKCGSKVWGAIFVCMVCRAVHLELVSSATAEEFMNAFKRFTNRRGVPEEVLSDNGTNFKLASKVLKELWKPSEEDDRVWQKILQSRNVQQQIAAKGIKWNFIPERAAWMGGMYERLVALIKHPLRRVLGQKRLVYEELTTLLTEIEYIVNLRPLMYLSESDVNRPIRPIDFLIPYPSVNWEEKIKRIDREDKEYFVKQTSKSSLEEKYHLAMEYANEFWDVWIKAYLLSLREKEKSSRNDGSIFPKVGDVVIISDPEINRSVWKMGVVTELIPGKDGKVRVAKVKTKSNVLTRAIKHLYPLEQTKPNCDELPNEENVAAVICLGTMAGTMADDEIILNVNELQEEAASINTNSQLNEGVLTVDWLSSCQGHSVNGEECKPFPLKELAMFTSRGNEKKTKILISMGELKAKSLWTVWQVFTAMENYAEDNRALAVVINNAVEGIVPTAVSQSLNKEVQKGNLTLRQGKLSYMHVGSSSWTAIISMWVNYCRRAHNDVFESPAAITIKPRYGEIGSWSQQMLEGVNIAKATLRNQSFANAPLVFVGNEVTKEFAKTFGRSRFEAAETKDYGDFFSKRLMIGPNVKQLVIFAGHDIISAEQLERREVGRLLYKPLLQMTKEIMALKRKAIIVSPPYASSRHEASVELLEAVIQVELELGNELKNHFKFLGTLSHKTEVTDQHGKPTAVGIRRLIDRLVGIGVPRQPRQLTKKEKREAEKPADSEQQPARKSLDERIRELGLISTVGGATLAEPPNKRPRIQNSVKEKISNNEDLRVRIEDEAWVTRLSPLKLQEIKEVILWLQRKLFGTLCICGSIGTTLGGTHSDIDVTVIVSNAESYLPEGCQAQIKRIKHLMSKCEEVENAAYQGRKTPVCRVLMKTGQKIDVTFQNVVSLKNTLLIRAYADYDMRVRKLYTVIKGTFKELNLNDSQKGTLNSYSIALLTIFFLQRTKPPILPVLSTEEWNRKSNEQLMEELRIENAESPTERGPYNQDSNWELIGKFFKFFADFDFEYFGISVKEGKTFDRDGVGESHPIQIEEPFHMQDNTARTVTRDGARSIRHRIRNIDKRISRKEYDHPPKGLSIAKWLATLAMVSLFSTLLASAEREREIKPMVCAAGLKRELFSLTQDCEELILPRRELIKNRITFYESDSRDFEFSGYKCTVVKQWADYYTNLLNDQFAKPNQSVEVISADECWRMVKYNQCAAGGTLFASGENVWMTHNKLEVDFSYWTIGSKHTEKVNCFVEKIPLLGDPIRKTLETALADTKYCGIDSGECPLEDGSVIVWDKVKISKLNCRFKEKGTYNGTYNGKYWRSNDGQLGLTFEYSAPVVEDCSRSLVVSTQGYAIPYTDYNKLYYNRAKRNAEKGNVFTTQLSSQLTAVSINAYESLEVGVKQVAKLVCDNLKRVGHSMDDATMLARKLMNNDYIQARLVSEELLEVWRCAPVKEYKFRVTENCYHKLPINVTIDGEEWLTGFLDTVTMIVQIHSNEGPCSVFQDSVVKIDGKIMRVDQKTGKVIVEHLVKELPWQGITRQWNSLPPMIPFRNLVLSNLTDGQKQMLALLRPFRHGMNAGVFVVAGNSKQSLFGETKSRIESAAWFDLIPWPSGWEIMIRCTVLIIWAKWIMFDVYPKFLEWRMGRRIRRTEEPVELAPVHGNVDREQMRRWLTEMLLERLRQAV